ncbi:hypothetical protein K3495_g9879 [Podosphaera aphanis]|nr:hypothetical protein K3495_g9879 [Podosphaera aphanis]
MLNHIFVDPSAQTLFSSLLSSTTDLDSIFSSTPMPREADKDELPQLSVWPEVSHAASPSISLDYQNNFEATDFQTRDLTPACRSSPSLKYFRLNSPISSVAKRQHVGQRYRNSQHPREPGVSITRTTISSQETLHSPLRESHAPVPDLLAVSEENASVVERILVDFNIDEGYYDMPGVEVNSSTGGVWSQIEVLVAACRVMRTYERVGRLATPGIWRRSADCMQSGRPMVRNRIRMRKTAQQRGG